MSHPKRIETVHLETLNGELCLYDWQRMEVHNLNPTAATVWQLCDGQTSPQQMARQLKGDLTPAQAEELVWLTLARLEKAHLLQEAVVKPAGHKVISRRDMLKGLGLAAAMLPVVTSIVAPGPVEAQSPQPPQPVQPIVMYDAGGSWF
ncbi:MAG: PqqD family protein [Anaerolineales bacterium]|nr:PqqD family protein [Anaerolineales bacterium]